MLSQVPCVVSAAATGLIAFTIAIQLFGYPLRHTDMWWILVVAPVMGAIITAITALINVRKLGLRYFATMGEFMDAKNQNGGRRK